MSRIFIDVVDGLVERGVDRVLVQHDEQRRGDGQDREDEEKRVSHGSVRVAVLGGGLFLVPLEMLVGQAAIAFELFFGVAPSEDDEDALRALLLK